MQSSHTALFSLNHLSSLHMLISENEIWHTAFLNMLDIKSLVHRISWKTQVPQKSFESETRDSFHKYICWLLCWDASKSFRHSSLTNFHLVLTNLKTGTMSLLWPLSLAYCLIYIKQFTSKQLYDTYEGPNKYLLKFSRIFLLRSYLFPHLPPCISITLNLLINHLSLESRLFYFLIQYSHSQNSKNTIERTNITACYS